MHFPAIVKPRNSQKASVYKCTLGIDVISTNPEVLYDETTGTLKRTEHVKISSINATNPQINTLSVGDVITKISVNGKETVVTRRHHVIDALFDARVGSEIIITVVRAGTEINCTVNVTNDMIRAYK